MKSATKVLISGVILLASGLGLMLLETIIFQFIYGWHWKAIGPYERTADFICNIIIQIGLFLVYVVVFRVILFVLSLYDEYSPLLDAISAKEEKKEQNQNK